MSRAAEDSCFSEETLFTEPPCSPTGLVALRLTSLAVIIKSDTFLCHYLPCIMPQDIFLLLLYFYLSGRLENQSFFTILSLTPSSSNVNWPVLAQDTLQSSDSSISLLSGKREMERTARYCSDKTVLCLWVGIPVQWAFPSL